MADNKEFLTITFLGKVNAGQAMAEAVRLADATKIPAEFEVAVGKGGFSFMFNRGASEVADLRKQVHEAYSRDPDQRYSVLGTHVNFGTGLDTHLYIVCNDFK